MKKLSSLSWSLIDQRNKETLPSIATILILICVTGMSVFFKRYIVLQPFSVEEFETRHLAGLLVSIAFIWVKCEEFPKSALYILRPIFISLAAYLTLAHHMVPVESLPPAYFYDLNIGRILAVICFVCAWWRPSLGLYSLAYFVWYKNHISSYYRISVSITDYMPLVDVAIFLVTGMVLLHCLSKFLAAETHSPRDGNLGLGNFLILSALAIHYSGYFYSAIEKLTLGEGVFDWVLYNQTHYLMLNAYALGQLPTSFNMALSTSLFKTLGLLVVPTNAFIIISQLFVVIALKRVSWLIWLTILYDITHLVIFLVSGIFFYKWMILNAAVILALLAQKRARVSISQWVILSSFLVVAPQFYFVAKLGWFDTSSLNLRYVEVLDDEEEVYRVPSNYFMPFSVTAAQSRLVGGREGFFPSRTYGVVNDLALMKQLNECSYQLDFTKDYTQNGDFYKKFTNVYRLYQPQVIKYLDGYSLGYDLYPHHVFSMPWQYLDFKKLDKSRIQSIQHVSEAICFTSDSHHPFEYKILRRGSHTILSSDHP
ncbi:MAG: hypothetical protein KUG79_01625 [Pseudomonadales bacterium]|nr:hypothetical protein [Pseudomonadales bacterium]